MIPHVTNHDDADITELEAFRVQLNKENEKQGVKLTMLAFLIKACVAALKKFPEFNASLDGETLVLQEVLAHRVRRRHAQRTGGAGDQGRRPEGHHRDRARAAASSSAKARDGKLSPADMQGGTFSISSLGRHRRHLLHADHQRARGGDPRRVPLDDAAGLGRQAQFAPRLILPLSLSWDHRVIDGAAAARFNAYLAQLLADFRRTML